MKLTKMHWIGVGVGIALILIAILFADSTALFFLIGMGILITSLPFVVTVITETKVASEKEEMFLEFARNLVESVKTGTPISKSIINSRNKEYSVLNVHIRKLANQISMGIPVSTALKTFSKDVNNKVISRAISLIGQAERMGGEIGEILESVAEAVSTSDKLKKERKAAISTLVVQGYIIFCVFIIIILVMQFKILPMISGITGGGIAGLGSGSGGISQSDISTSFLYMLLVQGFFSGLTIGKLSENNIKAGIKHSFILMAISFMISVGANLFFG